MFVSLEDGPPGLLIPPSGKWDFVESRQPLLLQIYFPHHSSLLRLSWHECRSPIIVPLVPEALFISFSCSSSSYSDQIHLQCVVAPDAFNIVMRLWILLKSTAFESRMKDMGGIKTQETHLWITHSFSDDFPSRSTCHHLVFRLLKEPLHSLCPGF